MADWLEMHLIYKFRLLPTKTQHECLARLLEDQRVLYNAALEERIGAYRATGRGRTYMDQCKALTVCRRDLPEMASIPANIQRWTIKRLDDAFQGFFRRIKTRNGKAGFPRFRSRDRFNSFGFAEFSGITFDGKRLRFKGLPGALRLHLHREVPKSIKACVLKRDDKGWAVAFQCEIQAAHKRPVQTAIGIDLGLNVFSFASDGVVVPNPRIARRAEKKLRRRQRALARCKRGSNRRKKVKRRVSRMCTKIADTRRTWLHQQSAALVKRTDLIAAEDLRVANMVKNEHLARSISDAGWSMFLSMVSYKAERAGAHFVTVDPKNTSQICSGCGEKVPKSLAVRTHSCPHCGLVIDRDRNASLNILAAVVGRGERNVAGCSVRALGNLTLKGISK